MHFHLKSVHGRIVAVGSLALAFILIAGTAFASMTFDTNTITGSGALNLNPTGQPVTVNGDLHVTGSCTGCGGGGGTPGGSNTEIQFNDGGSFGGSPNLTWDGTSVLQTGGFVPDTSDLFGPTYISISPIDGATAYIAATSDGFAGSQYDFAFLAQAGDKDLGDGSTLSTNAFSRMGEIYIDYNDTTDPNSVDAGFTLFSNSRNDDEWGVNASGDFGIGRVTYSAGFPTPINANIVINGATGNTVVKGSVIADSFQTAPTDTGPMNLVDNSPTKLLLNTNTDATFDLTMTNASKDPNHYNAGAFLKNNGAFWLFSGKDEELILQGQPSDNGDALTAGAWTLQGDLVDNSESATYSLGRANNPWKAAYAKTFNLIPTTVSALPTCNSGAKGTQAYVTDSNTATWGATVAGGSTNNVGVSCNGTNWTVVSK